ncbi:hypothetical protein D3C87_1413500 [compost metagenome]
MVTSDEVRRLSFDHFGDISQCDFRLADQLTRLVGFTGVVDVVAEALLRRQEDVYQRARGEWLGNRGQCSRITQQLVLEAHRHVDVQTHQIGVVTGIQATSQRLDVDHVRTLEVEVGQRAQVVPHGGADLGGFTLQPVVDVANNEGFFGNGFEEFEQCAKAIGVRLFFDYWRSGQLWCVFLE